MDALIVKERFDILRNAHVVNQVLAPNVCRGDDTIPGQLPNMEFVDGEHALYLRT